MLDFLKTLMQPSVGSATWIIIMSVILAAALLCCFAGYRVLRVMMAAGGFALGVLIGCVLLQSMDWPGWILTILIVLIGIVAGVVSYLMFRLGLFLLAGVATFFMVGGLLGTFMKEDQLTLMIIIAAVGSGARRYTGTCLYTADYDYCDFLRRRLVCLQGYFIRPYLYRNRRSSPVVDSDGSCGTGHFGNFGPVEGHR